MLWSSPIPLWVFSGAQEKQQRRNSHPALPCLTQPLVCPSVVACVPKSPVTLATTSVLPAVTWLLHHRGNAKSWWLLAVVWP